MHNNEKYVEILSEGVMYKRRGEYEKAKEKYIEAINMDSNNATGYYNLGKILYILGDYEASIRSYKIAFELGIEPYNLMIHLGHAINDNGLKDSRWKDVILFYKRGINPALIKKYMNNMEEMKRIMSINPKASELNEYEQICINAAKEYLHV